MQAPATPCSPAERLAHCLEHLALELGELIEEEPSPFSAGWEIRCGPRNRFRVFYTDRSIGRGLLPATEEVFEESSDGRQAAAAGWRRDEVGRAHSVGCGNKSR